MLNISICIPTYNQSAYLERSIRSAYEQSYKALEIIVCDDSSTDDSKVVLERLKLEIPILKVFYQPNNQGISKNVDACLRMATGDLILRLDSDDLIFPDYLKKVSKVMANNPDAGYGHVAIQEIDQYDKPKRIRRLFRSALYLNADDALRVASKGYRVAANIVMFRKVALEKVGYITSRLNFAEDWHLSVNIAAAGYGNIYLDEVLASYRVWDDAGKVRQHRKLAEIKGITAVFELALEPAYTERGWNLKELKAQRSSLAAVHADCLGWDNYTIIEKREIIDALLKLSSSTRVKTMIWIYCNGFGTMIQLVSKAKDSLKSIVKKLILSVKSNHQTAS
jgi:glycosyltransferase involved in cell wall biosynthesis